MSRFYVPKESVKGKRIDISGKEAHHIIDVMRLKLSDEVVLFDGTGKEYTGIVKEAGRKSLSVEITGTRNAGPEEAFSVTLIQAIPKKDKMDYIAEKATELGVSCIMPVTTARTIPDWSGAKKARVVERWQKIAVEAAKQCGRMDIPEVAPIMSFEEAVCHCEGAKRPKQSQKIDCFAPSGLAMTTRDLKLIAALSDKAIKLKEELKGCAARKIVIAIGPEGDFTPVEIKAAQDRGFKIVSLGPRVLKSDTAGLAVLAMINYEYTS